MINAEKAQRAMDAMTTYIRAVGADPAEMEIVVTDLLADLMHYCDKSRSRMSRLISFNDCLKIARKHFRYESVAAEMKEKIEERRI